MVPVKRARREESIHTSYATIEAMVLERRHLEGAKLLPSEPYVNKTRKRYEFIISTILMLLTLFAACMKALMESTTS